eukprot:gene10609-7731_t
METYFEFSQKDPSKLDDDGEPMLFSRCLLKLTAKWLKENCSTAEEKAEMIKEHDSKKWYEDDHGTHIYLRDIHLKFLKTWHPEKCDFDAAKRRRDELVLNKDAKRKKEARAALLRAGDPEAGPAQTPLELRMKVAAVWCAEREAGV